MKYKIICPVCGTKLSRWHYFSTASIHCQCRSCGARFRMTTFGWLLTLFVVMLEILLLVLFRREFISRLTALGLLLTTCALAIWLLPSLTPVQLQGGAKNNPDKPF